MQPEQFQTRTTARATTFDAGLNAFFRHVYNTMAVGLVLTGLIAWMTAASGLSAAIMGNGLLHFVVMLAPLGFIFFGFTPRKVQAMSPVKLAGVFYAFSALFGLSLGYIFLAYSGESIARTFFITAGMFAGMSVFGYTTKKDLSGMGSLMIMGAWGVFLALLVNMFLHSAMLHFVVSVMGVIIYTGLTAWDTQRLKETYSVAAGVAGNQKLAIMGALSLYLNFLNLFMFLLQFTGGNRN